MRWKETNYGDSWVTYGRLWGRNHPDGRDLMEYSRAFATRSQFGRPLHPPPSLSPSPYCSESLLWASGAQCPRQFSRSTWPSSPDRRSTFSCSSSQPWITRLRRAGDGGGGRGGPPPAGRLLIEEISFYFIYDHVERGGRARPGFPEVRRTAGSLPRCFMAILRVIDTFLAPGVTRSDEPRACVPRLYATTLDYFGLCWRGIFTYLSDFFFCSMERGFGGKILQHNSCGGLSIRDISKMPHKLLGNLEYIGLFLYRFYYYKFYYL